MASASDFDSEYGCSTQPSPAIWLGIARHLHSIYKSNCTGWLTAWNRQALYMGR